MPVQPYTKKAQIHMGETIAVLIIFIIILVFGLFLYFQYSYSSIQGRGLEFQETEYSTLLYSITDSPEFTCTKGNCIDMTKIIALKQLNYRLKNKEIKIEIIYPEPLQKRECTIEDYSNQNYPNMCNFWQIPALKTIKKITSKPVVKTPISLYYPETDEFKIGLIYLTIYQ